MRSGILNFIADRGLPTPPSLWVFKFKLLLHSQAKLDREFGIDLRMSFNSGTDSEVWNFGEVHSLANASKSEPWSSEINSIFIFPGQIGLGICDVDLRMSSNSEIDSELGNWSEVYCIAVERSDIRIIYMEKKWKG